MEPFPNQEGSVSRLTTLTTVMHAGSPKTFSSSGYKSQKKNQTQGRGRREQTERRSDREEKARGQQRGERKKQERERRNIEKAKGRADESNRTETEDTVKKTTQRHRHLRLLKTRYVRWPSQFLYNGMMHVYYVKEEKGT